jgi:hypothetical protein
MLRAEISHKLAVLIPLRRQDAVAADLCHWFESAPTCGFAPLASFKVAAGF